MPTNSAPNSPPRHPRPPTPPAATPTRRSTTRAASDLSTAWNGRATVAVTARPSGPAVEAAAGNTGRLPLQWPDAHLVTELDVAWDQPRCGVEHKEVRPG